MTTTTPPLGKAEAKCWPTSTPRCSASKPRALSWKTRELDLVVGAHWRQGRRARLDKSILKSATHQSEVTRASTIAVAAQEEDSRGQAQARRAEQPRSRAKAAEAEVNYRWLVEHGPQLSEHAVALAALLAEVKRRIDANHALGFQFPTSMQFISAMTRATSRDDHDVATEKF